MLQVGKDLAFTCTSIGKRVQNPLTLDLSSVRNNIDYERALYLANAGVHAVAAELEANPAWRGTLFDGAYPGNDTYSATAVSGPSGSALVTSRGVSGSVTRTIAATFQL